MNGEYVDFVPERSQLARLTPPADAPAAPPAWVAALAVAGALGLSLSMALPPTARVHGGAVTRVVDDVPPGPTELLQPAPALADK